MYRALRSFNLNGKRVNRFDLLPSVPSHLEGTFLRARFIEHHEPDALSLSSMKKPELLALADQRGVTVPAGARVADIRELLREVS